MATAVLLVGTLVLVPGSGAALAAALPGSISIESRIALAFGLGYGLVAGVAVLLALAHMFSKASFVVGICLATVVVWGIAFLRAKPSAHRAGFAAQIREAPVGVAIGAALLVAVAVSSTLVSPRLNLTITSAWRYWADGLEISAAGHVPPTTAQWGTEIPTTVSKLVFNAFEGGVSYLLGPSPLGPMHGILTVTTVGLTAALLALGRELGLRLFAPLVPLVALFAPSRLPLPDALAVDLKTYKAENVGRMVAFALSSASLPSSAPEEASRSLLRAAFSSRSQASRTSYQPLSPVWC